MFDHIALEGIVKPIDPVDWNRFEQVAFLKNNGTNFKPTVCYRESPITEAQFNVTPSTRRHKGTEYLNLTFQIPVNAVLNGANIIPGDAQTICRTLKALAGFLRWFLYATGFTPAEVDYFIAQIRHVGEDDRFSLYADAAGGQLKCYLKSEQVRTRDRKNREKNFLSDEMRPHAAAIVKEVETHVRLEVVLEPEMLKKHGLESPKDWATDKVTAAIEDVWKMLGLSIIFANRNEQVSIAGLRP